MDAIALQADGKILIGGAFTSAGGAARNRIARLLASGAIDASFDPGAGANDEVVTLLLQADGKVVAGGDFTTVAGQARSRIVRLLVTGGIDPAFSASAAANATVLSLGGQADGKIFLSGAFTQVNGTARNRLARLNADGSLDTTFDPGDGANKDVRAVLTRSDGTVFLGGLFDQYQGASVNEVVAITGTPVATSLLRAPQSIAVNAGTTARFVAEAIGPGLSYRWFKEGVAIAGETDATLALNNVTTGTQGRYTLQVTSASGATLSSDVVLTVNAVAVGVVSSISNVSVRTTLAAAQTLIMGFTMNGGSKSVVVRAVGPGLATFSVPGVMADPKLQLFKDTTKLDENDNWSGPELITAFASVGAFPLTLGSKDAALVRSIEGGHTAQITGTAAGTVLVEAYDAGGGLAPRLSNVSARNRVGTGADILIAGFTVAGTGPKNLLIRAVGPTLAGFGVGGTLADPKFEVYNSGGTKISESDTWAGGLASVFTSVGAFPLAAGSKDAALIISLPPGGYTVQVSGADGGTGEALVELYELP